jgi:hypothetical protein
MSFGMWLMNIPKIGRIGAKLHIVYDKKERCTGLDIR